METSEYGYEDPSLIINAGEGRHSVNRWHANFLCIFSTVFMFCVRFVVTKYGKPGFVRADVDYWKWRNILISWINGLIVGPWGFLCVWWYPDLIRDPVFYINNLIYLLVPFCIGYFLYDLLDILIEGRMNTEWEVVLHHVVLIGGMSYAWNVKICSSYSVMLLLAEINSIFLHLRKLLQYAQVRFDSVLYRTVKTVNMFSFIACRLLPQAQVAMALFVDGHRVPKPFFIANIAMVPIGFLINIILFWRLIQTDVLRPLLGIQKRKKK